MIKGLLILFVCLFSFNIKAQDPDPNLFRTWYLYYVMSSDLGTPYWVPYIDPPIDPYLTIHEDLTFEGEGACNSFTGIYEYFYNDLSRVEFIATNEDCDPPIHNFFENEYFSFLEYFWYSIEDDDNGLALFCGNPIFGEAYFRDYPILSMEDNLLGKIVVFPNPVQDYLKINNTSTTGITSIKIYDVLGRLLLTERANINQVDVSHLKSGVLFVKIETELGVLTMKIIKV